MRTAGFVLVAMTLIFAMTLYANAENQFGRLPGHFEENRGQAPADVKFLSKGLAYTLLFRGNDTTLQFDKDSLRVKFAGSNHSPRIIGESLLEGKSNYFVSNNPAHWKTNIPQFGQVKYESVYDGIDVLYHANHSELEYDFIIRPGADPGRIAIAFENAQQVRIDRNGELIIKKGKIGRAHV